MPFHAHCLPRIYAWQVLQFCRAAEFPSFSQNHNHPYILERPANREAERPCRLEIVETPRSQHQPVQGRLDLRVEDIRIGALEERFFARLDEIGGRNDLRMQTAYVISVINPERRCNDRQ